VATSRSGALRVCRLAFKQLGYKLRGVFDVGTNNLRRLCDGPLHHWLKGDLRVPALEACWYILRHCLRQGTTTTDFLQLQHLGSSGVKEWGHDADLLHKNPNMEGTEAKGHQCSLGLA
jgi:hypothetical protein